MNLFENLQMMNKTVVTENDKLTVLNSIESTKEFVSNNLKLINDQAFASVLREIIFQSNIEWKDVQSIISRHMPEVKIEDLQMMKEQDDRIKFDFENGEKIYKEIVKLFKDEDIDSFYNPNKSNVFENDADGEIYIEDGVINIYASYDEESGNAQNNKYFSIEIVESNNIIDEKLNDLYNIISKYDYWEIID